MADDRVGFVVLVTSTDRPSARLLQYGRIFPTVEAAAEAIADQVRMFGTFFHLRVAEVVPPAELAGLTS